MNYEVGKQYEMRVVDIRVDSAGYNYIALHDDDPSKEYRVYNILFIYNRMTISIKEILDTYTR